MQFKKIVDVKSPSKGHDDDAGWDFYSPVDIDIFPGQTMTIGLGIQLEIGVGYFGLAVERSSQGKNGITSTAKIIDSGYRGEIHATLNNSGTETYHIHKGDKILQVIFVPHYMWDLKEVKELSETQRGDGGYGSTGK